MIQTRADNNKLTIWYGMQQEDILSNRGEVLSNSNRGHLIMQSPTVQKGLSKTAHVVSTRTQDTSLKNDNNNNKTSAKMNPVKTDPSKTKTNPVKTDPKSILVSSKGSQANSKEIKKTLQNNSFTSSSAPITSVSSSINEPIRQSPHIFSPPLDLSSSPALFPPVWEAQPIAPPEFRGSDFDTEQELVKPKKLEANTDIFKTEEKPVEYIPKIPKNQEYVLKPEEYLLKTQKQDEYLRKPVEYILRTRKPEEYLHKPEKPVESFPDKSVESLQKPEECIRKTQKSDEFLLEKNSLLGVINTSLETDPEESDAEDLFKKIASKKDASVESELDESILSVEEDDDFKVHFVHHGKKSSTQEPEMNHRPDLAQQIAELQDAVVSMKGSLRDAVTNLSSVVNDTSAVAQVDQVRKKCEGNSGEILKMVLALRTDLSSLKNDVTSISNRQESIQKSVSLLLEDRRALANDLSHAGVISQHTRNRLDCFNGVVEMIGAGHHSGGSGSHSNDSGVALMLEKSLGSFAEDSAANMQSAAAGQHRVSDQDSLPDQPSLLVPPSVYDYVAGLNQQNLSLTSSTSNGESSLLVKEENEARILDGGGDEMEINNEGYDSDSSVTVAANKTISLSASLSQQMKANENWQQGEMKANENWQQVGTRGTFERNRKKKTPRGAAVTTAAGSGDYEKIDLAKEAQNRRRRPLLGVSSAKMYHVTSHNHENKERYGAKHKRHHQSTSTTTTTSESQRYKIAKEFLDAEKKYCKTLLTIQETFAEPLKKADILSNKDITTLFPEEVYQLYDKHCILQHQLKERLTSWKWQPIIGDILARFTDPRHCEVLRIYTNYVNEFPEILKTFHKLCHTSQPFTEFIKTCLDQPSCSGQDLGSFLLTPVQRIPRYILLLKQLLKCTDICHPDYRLINTCLDRLRDFLIKLNDAMENSFRLVHSSLAATLHNSNSTSKYNRASRSPKRSDKSRPNPSSSRSPSDRRNRHATPIYEPTLIDSDSFHHHQQPQTHHHHHHHNHHNAAVAAAASRSASLPRGFLSSSDSTETSPERASSGLQKSNSTMSHDAAAADPYQQLPLTGSRSVTTLDLPDRRSADDLTSSQPSLIDGSKCKKIQPALSAAHSAQNVATAHKLVTWTDSLDSDESKSKKKNSIKTSIKHMFGFKKRSLTKNGREEPIYWPSSVSSIILENSSSEVPQPQQQKYSTVSTIGDFVDEDGNPCSNV